MLLQPDEVHDLANGGNLAKGVPLWYKLRLVLRFFDKKNIERSQPDKDRASIPFRPLNTILKTDVSLLLLFGERLVLYITLINYVFN